MCDSRMEHQQQLLNDGDGSQIICVHDSNNNHIDESDIVSKEDNNDGDIKKARNKRKIFISDAMFNAKIMKVQKDTIKWADLPINIVYKIDKVKTVDTKFGKQKIADLSSRTGPSYHVWLTTLISNELEKRDNVDGEHYYIKSLGLKNSKKNVERKYFDFQLLNM